MHSKHYLLELELAPPNLLDKMGPKRVGLGLALSPRMISAFLLTPLVREQSLSFLTLALLLSSPSRCSYSFDGVLFKVRATLIFVSGLAGLTLLVSFNSLSVVGLLATKPMGGARVPRFLTLAFPLVGRMESATVVTLALGLKVSPMEVAAKR